MAHHPNVNRDVLVFSIWSVLGVPGLCFLVEGFARAAYLVSLMGIALIIASLAAHVIVNSIFDQGFTDGEAPLGIAVLGVVAVVFVLGWAEGDMPLENFYAGLTLFGVLVFGFVAYLVTRYGMRGAFSHFHIKPSSLSENGR